MRDAVAAASLASPPDVVITVGSPGPEPQGEPRNYSYQFVAHKHLVSLHSGYLKSLIQNESSLNSSSSLTSISVPSITPDTFAPLLSFMYTGYLELTNENIYSVLLATHLLHMPRALDLCRAYLVQNQPEFQRNPEYRPNVFPFQNNPNIIKPIPSRKIHNFPHPFWPPVNVPPLLLHTTPNGPFQSVPHSEKLEIATEPQRLEEPKSPLAIPSTSKTEDRDRVSPPSSVSPCLSTASFTSDERTVHIIKSPQRKNHKKKENSTKTVKKVNNENIKAVLDVACCDGPVRFHRVLNENYGMSLDELIDDSDIDKVEQSPEKITDKEYLENYPKTQFLKMKSNKKFSNFMHQQMLNSNLYNKKSKSTKGVIQLRKIIEKEIHGQEKPRDENETENETEDENPDKIYTCVYCKHTFKSQYCYQKHARRHINPVEDASGNNKNMVIVRKVVSTTKVDGKEGGSNVRREVRLLDMNVQYYPCKTCGSKFPSYYFVHKHRKLCHSNEENLDENSNHAVENSDSSSQTPQTKA